MKQIKITFSKGFVEFSFNFYIVKIAINNFQSNHYLFLKVGENESSWTKRLFKKLCLKVCYGLSLTQAKIERYWIFMFDLMSANGGKAKTKVKTIYTPGHFQAIFSIV